MIPNRKILLPVLVWALMCAGVFVAALAQQETGLHWVPGLSLSNVFGWVASVLILYLVLVWPITLEDLMEKYARQQLRQGAFLLQGAMGPGLLLLYGVPVLVATATFGAKGIGPIFQTLLVLGALFLATIAHFSLGFFFRGNFAKPYFLVMGGLCALAPLTNHLFEALYGEGPSFLNLLNPFHAVFCVASPGGAETWSWLTFVLVFGALGTAFFAVPILLAWPPRVYEDLP